MVGSSDVVADNGPLLPPQTKQAARAIFLLLFFSLLMFSLPFGSFFGVQYVLHHYNISGFVNTFWSVVAAVLNVNLIILIYACIAFHEPEYDNEGNLIKEPSSKENLNLKQD